MREIDITKDLKDSENYFAEVVALRNKGNIIMSELLRKKDLLNIEIYRVQQAQKQLDLEFLHQKPTNQTDR